jgi:hypothetical protein
LLACAPAPCTSSIACGRAQVCGLDGRCGPLGLPLGARFAGSRWIDARDWAVAGDGDTPRSDALLVGAGRESLLAFGPLPPGHRILRAVLVLHPHDGEDRIADDAEIVVEHVEPFRGGALPARREPGPLTFAAARAALARGPARPLRVDVTGATQNAAGRRDQSLYVLLRRTGGGLEPALFASPWAIGDRIQPRVEILVH